MGKKLRGHRISKYPDTTPIYTHVHQGGTSFWGISQKSPTRSKHSGGDSSGSVGESDENTTLWAVIAKSSRHQSKVVKCCTQISSKCWPSSSLKRRIIRPWCHNKVAIG